MKGYHCISTTGAHTHLHLDNCTDFHIPVKARALHFSKRITSLFLNNFLNRFFQVNKTCSPLLLKFSVLIHHMHTHVRTCTQTDPNQHSVIKFKGNMGHKSFFCIQWEIECVEERNVINITQVVLTVASTPAQSSQAPASKQFPPEPSGTAGQVEDGKVTAQESWVTTMMYGQSFKRCLFSPHHSLYH